jgi:hypothetical protein
MYLKSGAREMFCAGGGERGGQATNWATCNAYLKM